MKYSAKDIEDIIYKYLPGEEGYQIRVIEAMNYAFKAGGKRLRPLMMRLCFDMFSKGDDKELEVLYHFMAAVEMIHTYSLIHDDLPALDNDDLRRGRPTVHKVYGEDIAILAGDGLLNYAFEVASEAFMIMPGDKRVERAFCVLSRKPGIYGMIGGQTLDVLMSGSRLDDKQIEYIYLNKTSALIECAMTIGAILAGACDESVEKISLIARNVGMAFQVQDDILDLIGDESTLGKPVLSDEKNEKVTYVTIHGIDEAKEYVKETSDSANRILSGIDCIKNDAKSELMDLIQSLINRKM